MTVIEALPDWPETARKAAGNGIGFFPPIWAKYAKKAHRTLAWAADGMLTTEDGDEFPYHDAADLRVLLHEASSHGCIVYMPDAEFARWMNDFLHKQQGIWSDSAAKIVGYKVKSGRRTRYIYRASVWPGLTSADDLWQLRRFLDDWGVGDVGTPGALGIRVMHQLYPDKAERQFRPQWQAWQCLYDHLIAGRTQLFQPFKGEKAVEVDMNSAYAAAIKEGVPQGRCWPIWREEDAEDSPWFFGHYTFTIPEGCKFGLLGTRPAKVRRTKLSWPTEGEGDGWYTNQEIADARAAGYICTFTGDKGWAWERISTAFAPWADWMQQTKEFYRRERGDADEPLKEEVWTKLATVSAIGRLGMDRYEKIVFLTEDVGEQWARTPWESDTKGIMLVEKHCPSNRGDLLIQVCVQVHAYVRRQMALAHGLIVADGLSPTMCNIDAWYVGGTTELPDIGFGPGLGQWKKKDLTLQYNGSNIEIEKAGWVKAGNLNKTPGVSR